MKRHERIVDVTLEECHQDNADLWMYTHRYIIIFLLSSVFLLTNCNVEQENVVTPHYANKQSPENDVEYVFKGKLINEIELLRQRTGYLILISEETPNKKVRFQVFDNDPDFIAWASGTKDGARLIAGHKASRQVGQKSKGKDMAISDHVLGVQQQQAILCSEWFYKGKSLTITPRRSYPNLEAMQFNKLTASVRNNSSYTLALFENKLYQGSVIYVRPYQSLPVFPDWFYRKATLPYFFLYWLSSSFDLG